MKFIKETTTSRVLNHIQRDDTWAIVSPYRSENSDIENKKLMLQLKSDVKSKYGFIQLLSRWVEDEINFDEQSLFIPKCSLRDALALGHKYNQSSIIFKNDEGCVEICTNPFENYDKTDIVRTFNINTNKALNIEDAIEIFSKRKGGPVSKPMKGSRPLTLKEIYEIEQERPSYFQSKPTKSLIYFNKS